MEVDRGAEVERLVQVQKEMTSLLARLGDRAQSPSAIEQQTAYIVERLIADAKRNLDVPYWDIIRKALLACGTELPHKAGMYAAVTGLLAVETEDGKSVSEKVANGASGLINKAVHDGALERARRALRFLCELCNMHVVSGEWILETIRTINDAARNDQRTTLHRRSSFLIDLAASALPWAARGLMRYDAADFSALAEDVLESLQQAADEEDQWIPMLLPADRKIAKYRMGLLLEALKDLSGREWATSSIPKLETGQFATKLENGPEMSLRSLQLPSHSKISRYTPPRFAFVFGTADNDGLEAGSKKYKSVAEKFILQEVTSDILDNFRSKHVDCAEKLLTLPIPLDANLEVVEAIFAELCNMPRTHHPQIFYGAVFVDLCRVKDSRLPLKLLSAVETLYSNSKSLDQELFDRLTEWFAFHLSNFGFKWNWSDWAACGREDAKERIPYKRQFCKDVLEQVSRLSYRDHVLSTIPEILHTLVPADLSAKTEDTEDNPNMEKVFELVAGGEKRNASEVKARLAGIIGVGEEEEHVRCLFAALVRAGEKTLAHFDATLERNLQSLTELMATTGQGGQRAVMRELWKLWPYSSLRAIYYLDKLCTYRVLNPSDVVEFLLSEKGLSNEEVIAKLETSSVWEAIRLLVDRQRSRMLIAKQEMTSAARFAASAAEGEATKASQMLEQAKETLESVKAGSRNIIFCGLTNLNGLHERLTEDDDMDDRTELPVWEWRVRGFCRELVRKNTDILEDVVPSLMELFGDVGEDATLNPMQRELVALKTLLTADIQG